MITSNSSSVLSTPFSILIVPGTLCSTSSMLLASRSRSSLLLPFTSIEIAPPEDILIISAALTVMSAPGIPLTCCCKSYATSLLLRSRSFNGFNTRVKDAVLVVLPPILMAPLPPALTKMRSSSGTFFAMASTWSATFCVSSSTVLLGNSMLILIWPESWLGNNSAPIKGTNIQEPINAADTSNNAVFLWFNAATRIPWYQPTNFSNRRSNHCWNRATPFGLLFSLYSYSISNLEDIIGTTVTDTTREATKAKQMVKANGTIICAVIPPTKTNGTYTAIVVKVDAVTAESTSCVPSTAAWYLLLPILLWRKIFSSTTVELSTTIPTESANAANVTIFSVWPPKYSMTKVEIIDSGMATPMIMVLRKLPKKIKITSMAITTAKNRLVSTLFTELIIWSAELYAIVNSISSYSSSSKSASALRTSLSTFTVFPSLSFWIPTAITSFPFNVT